MDLAGLTQTEHGLDTVLHLTCTNMEQGMVDDALKVCCILQTISNIGLSWFRLPRIVAYGISLPYEEVGPM